MFGVPTELGHGSWSKIGTLMSGPRDVGSNRGGAVAPIRRVCVVGLGYVGLPTAAVLASRGIEVLGVDVDLSRVQTVNEGSTPIAEPDLASMVRDAVASGRLRAETRVTPSDAFIIAVPTPFKGDHEPDLKHLRDAAASIAGVLVPGNLVVLESTSPVGTTEALCQWLAEARPDLSLPHAAGHGSDIRVAYSPERVLPGRILEELVANDRIIGGVTTTCSEAAQALYRCFVRGECSVTAARTAELVKLTENAYRDVNIAFANEISLVCDVHDIDPWELIDLANRHPRVDVLRPGPGVGGHCIAVDPWFVVHSAPGSTPLIRTARQVNEARPESIVEGVLSACEGLERPDIACLGLAYKADVADLRESPAIEVVERLWDVVQSRLLVVEPHIASLPERLVRERIELGNLDDALSAAPVVVLLTDHREFHSVDVRQLDGKRLVDSRGMWRGR